MYSIFIKDMDNYYQNCPPMMNYGFRELTSYKTPTRTNEYIKYVNGIWRNDEYRLFLQKNGKKLLDREWNYNLKNNRCFENKCVHQYPTRSTPRHMLQERELYDMINSDKHNNMKKCKKHKHYRLYD